MIIVTIITVVFLFSLLVIIHELGHFLAARRNGVAVDEFGIGFPPRLWGKKWRGTLYSINALPLGGFVSLKGETGTKGAKDSFAVQKTWTKTKILLAGVIMNLIVAYLLILFLAITGMPPLLSDKLPTVFGVSATPTSEAKMMVVQVTKDSAADKAGIEPADIIITINGQKIVSHENLKEFTTSHAGQSVDVVLQHKGKTKNFVLTLGTDKEKGVLGVASQSRQLFRYPIWVAPFASLVILWQMTIATLVAFGSMVHMLFTSAKVSDNVVGPVGITVIFGQITKFGYQYVMILLASISLSLGIINALPLPALDGGRTLVAWLQGLGVKITPKVERMTHLIGFIALILLGIIVAVTDVSRFIQ